MKRDPRDGSNDLNALTFTATSATADTLDVQVTDQFGNSVPGVYPILIAGDTVNEDIGVDGAAQTGLNTKLADEAAAAVAVVAAYTSAAGTYKSAADAVTGVTVRVTLLQTGETKEVTIA